MKCWLIGKDPDARQDRTQKEKGAAEHLMVGLHHQVDGREFEQTPGDTVRQRNLVSYSPWGLKESDRTQWLNNSKIKGKSKAKLKVNKICHFTHLTLSIVSSCTLNKSQPVKAVLDLTSSNHTHHLASCLWCSSCNSPQTNPVSSCPRLPPHALFIAPRTFSEGLSLIILAKNPNFFLPRTYRFLFVHLFLLVPLSKM